MMQALTLWVLAIYSGAQPACAEEPVLLACEQLSESSGLAVSTLDAEVVWSHNDSGDQPRLFAFDQRGQWLAEVRLAGAHAVDWEDMCSFERHGKHFLAIGDVGDNSANRGHVVLYVIEEPRLRRDSAAQKVELEVAQVERINVQYADGPVNCESLAYDPRRDQFLLATKETLRCRLYVVDAPSELGTGTQTWLRQAQRIQTLRLPLTTGADISRDGSQLVIATYGPACLLPRGDDGGWDAGVDSLQMLALPARRQGESICFAAQDRQLWLTSEFAPTPLWRVAVHP